MSASVDLKHAHRKSFFFFSTQPSSQTSEIETSISKTLADRTNTTEIISEVPLQKTDGKPQIVPIKPRHVKSRSEFSIKSMKFSAPNSRVNISIQKSLSNISDFYDPEQISAQFGTLQQTEEKVKYLDLINQRRKELKDLEEKMKLEKAAPLLQKFRANMRKKTIVKYAPTHLDPKEDSRKVGALRNALIYNRDNVIMGMGSPEDVLDGSGSKQQPVSLSFESPDKNAHDQANSSGVLETDTKPVILRKMSRESFAIAAFASFAKKKPTHLALSRVSPTQSNESGCELLKKIDEEDKELLEKKVNAFSEILKEKILNKEKKFADSESHEQFVLKKLKRPAKRWIPKLDNFTLGKKNLENDLYKFLVRNSTESAKDLILRAPSAGKPSLFLVEEKAEKRLRRREEKTKLENLLKRTFSSKSPGWKTGLFDKGELSPQVYVTDHTNQSKKTNQTQNSSSVKSPQVQHVGRRSLSTKNLAALPEV